MSEGSIEDKNHAFREKSSTNELRVRLNCPYNEAIIEENRIESALRDAFGVPDMQVIGVEFQVVCFEVPMEEGMGG